MSILDEILARTRLQLQLSRQESPLERLLERIECPPPGNFAAALSRPGVNIIAEIKYSSPSHGPFKCSDPPEQIAESYCSNGAVALSVLTEPHYFSGELTYLDRVGGVAGDVPMLRKDFVIDRYQIVEALAYRASACLLIVAALSQEQLADLLSYGHESGLEMLVEIHDAFELERAVECGARILGVNNRDLKTFRVDVDTSFEVARRLEGESGYLLVSESGIDDPVLIGELRDAGFSAFLVGSTLMDSLDPGARLKELLEGSGGSPE